MVEYQGRRFMAYFIDFERDYNRINVNIGISDKYDKTKRYLALQKKRLCEVQAQ